MMLPPWIVYRLSSTGRKASTPNEPPQDDQPGLACNVRDFGAVGDGLALDTLAIQAAIDACAARGGGVVEDVRVTNVIMTDVLCPFTMNLYYAPGAWGDATIADKRPHPVTDATPRFRRIHLSHLTARNARVANDEPVPHSHKDNQA